MKIINIHENFGVSFFIAFPFQCETCFNMQFHVSQKRYILFLLPILTSYSSWYRCVEKLYKAPYLAFGTHFFPKITSGETWNTAERVNDVMRIEISLAAVTTYCLAYCILYSIKSIKTSLRRSASAHVSLIYVQRIFYWLLRVYCFSNNFN